MSKRLEDFIKNNREEFDEIEPSRWVCGSKIESQISGQPVELAKKARSKNVFA
jgi:hypothetical protein